MFGIWFQGLETINCIYIYVNVFLLWLPHTTSTKYRIVKLGKIISTILSKRAINIYLNASRICHKRNQLQFNIRSYTKYHILQVFLFCLFRINTWPYYSSNEILYTSIHSNIYPSYQIYIHFQLSVFLIIIPLLITRTGWIT